MLGFVAKLFRSRREKPVSNIIPEEMMRTPICEIIAEEMNQLPIGSLDSNEKDHIQAVLKEIHGSSTELVAGFESSIEIILERIWYPEKAVERQRVAEIERQRIADEEESIHNLEDGLVLANTEGMYRRLRNEPDWYIAFTPDFKKAIKHVDRKRQGLILGAITYLTDSPLTPFGDTVKPLSANLNGLWRYRIGDHRLIYRPDESSKRIYLLSFAPRDAVYDA